MEAAYLVDLLLQDNGPTLRRYATMEDNTFVEFAGRDTNSDPLTDMLRPGAKRLIMHAIEFEVDEFLAPFSDQRNEDGKVALVCNGCHPER